MRQDGRPIHINVKPTPMPEEVKEIIADVLLQVAGKDDDHPAYAEEQMSRKRRTASHAEEYHGMLMAARHIAWDAESEEAVKHAGLSPQEQAAWRMYAEGHCISGIARAIGRSRPTAVRLVKSAARRLARYESAYHGLRAVYHQEVHRPIYRRPTHCTLQPCRKLGYCKFALGLDWGEQARMSE